MLTIGHVPFDVKYSVYDSVLPYVTSRDLVPVSTVPGRQHLRSASRRQLIVPRVRRSTFGARAFAIAGPTVWNSLPIQIDILLTYLLTYLLTAEFSDLE